MVALNIDATFEGKLTGAFKNDMRNLETFHQSIFESLKIGILMGSIYAKYNMYELKIYRGVCVMAMKNDAKFQEELTSQFIIDVRHLKNFDLSTRKSRIFAL